MMKNSFLHCLKSLMLVVGLLTTTSMMADNVIGQPITEFSDPETMKLDWPYTIQGAAKQLVRYKVLTFKIDAPAEGKYAVEYLVNTTGNNVQLAASASSDEYVYDLPEYNAFAHMITLTDEDLPIPTEPNEGESSEGDVEGEGETVEPFVPADPVYMYSSVDLQQGVNYVHVFMHIYWRQDNLAPHKVQFKSIRILPAGSGEVADVAARASQKAFRVKYFHSLQDATTATMVSDYEALLGAIKADYTKADTTAVVADIAAAEAKEQDVRHGKGVTVAADSTRIDLLLYHSEYDNSGNPKGGYDENGAYELEFGDENYPAQLEYTRTLNFTYKFTTGDIPAEGKWFIQYLASSKNPATINMTVLAEDSTTVIMPTYNLSTNNGDWQKYEFMDARNIAKFELESNKTYFLHLYYNDYSNVRDILVRYIPKEFHTVDQLEELLEQAQSVLAQFAEGTDGYYAVEDRTLLDNLDEAMAFAYEALGSGDEAMIDEAWEKVNEAILALSDLKMLNVIPSTIVNEETGESSFDVRSFAESKNCSYKASDGIMQLDNFQSGGYMIYKLYNKQDAEYKVDYEFAHANSGAKVEFVFYVPDENDPDIHFITADGISEELESSGGWQTFRPETMNIGAVPAGYVYLKITGTGPSYVGNPRKFVFTPIPGTEGNGAIALEQAKKDYYAQFTVESVSALVQQAKELIAPYAIGGDYDNLIVDRTPIEVCEAAIMQGEAAIANNDGPELKDAFYALTDAIAGMESLKIMNTLPLAEGTTFNLDSYSEINNVKIAASGGIKQLDSFKNNGYVIYKIWNTKDCEYEVSFEYGNQNPGAYLEFETYVMNDEDTIQYVCGHNRTAEEEDGNGGFAATGGWQVFVPKTGVKVGAMPLGHVYLRISGGENSPTYVGNMQNFVFTPIAGTEGYGAKALEEAMEANQNGVMEISSPIVRSNAIYRIDGQYVGNSVQGLPKGLYIIGNKKVLVK